MMRKFDLLYQGEGSCHRYSEENPPEEEMSMRTTGRYEGRWARTNSKTQTRQLEIHITYDTTHSHQSGRQIARTMIVLSINKLEPATFVTREDTVGCLLAWMN